MRRYAVRFLVAVLTFGIGLALSSVLGFFKPQEFKSELVFIRRSSCPKKFRAAPPTLIRTDSELGDPLKLTYLGETSDRQLKFLLENRRDQTISGYSLTGERIWQPHGSQADAHFTKTSNEVLEARESRLIVLPPATNGLVLRVASVTFQSGFTWINPREFTQ